MCAQNVGILETEHAPIYVDIVVLICVAAFKVEGEMEMDYSRLDKEKSNSAKKNRTHVKTSVFLDRIGAYDRLYGDELRAERFYRQQEDAAVRLRVKPQPFQCKEVMKNTKPVIQRQIHPSFLPESYLETEGMFTLPAELSAQIEEYARDNGGRMPENSDILRTALVQYAGVPDSNDPNSALGEALIM